MRLDLNAEGIADAFEPKCGELVLCGSWRPVTNKNNTPY
jgi:hypothetical protein